MAEKRRLFWQRYVAFFVYAEKVPTILHFEAETPYARINST